MKPAHLIALGAALSLSFAPLRAARADDDDNKNTTSTAETGDVIDVTKAQADFDAAQSAMHKARLQLELAHVVAMIKKERPNMSREIIAADLDVVNKSMPDVIALLRKADFRESLIERYSAMIIASAYQALRIGPAPLPSDRAITPIELGAAIGRPALVNVISHPNGAMIWLDGQLLKKTAEENTIIACQAGRHRIRLSKDDSNYKPIEDNCNAEFNAVTKFEKSLPLVKK